MPSILIVDDDTDTRDALGMFLQSKGYEVRYAVNGRDGLMSVLGRVPDLIVLDWRMPEMDGAKLLEVLRGYMRLRAVPVIVWTAYESESSQARARQLNASAILIKVKTSVNELRRTIESELRRPAE